MMAAFNLDEFLKNLGNTPDVGNPPGGRISLPAYSATPSLGSSAVDTDLGGKFKEGKKAREVIQAGGTGAGGGMTVPAGGETAGVGAAGGASAAGGMDLMGMLTSIFSMSDERSKENVEEFSPSRALDDLFPQGKNRGGY